MKSLYIGIDFDGTIVEHEYPEIGKSVHGAIETLKALALAGHKLILFTMRHGDTLTEAVEYLECNGITLYGVNENPSQTWSDSRKVYCHLYIDDAALGCPLVWSIEKNRPHVNWSKVNELLNARGLLPKG